MYNSSKTEDSAESRDNNDILLSRSVRAGKRMYYIDVKKDRHDEFYLSMTESKRVKDGTDFSRPVFEKHKIFLYREDMENFRAALNEAINYALAHSGNVESRHGYGEVRTADGAGSATVAGSADGENSDPLDLKIEF